MIIEVVNASKKVKKADDSQDGKGGAYVTFSLVLRADKNRELIGMIRGCLYAQGKIYPPRQRMPNGYYRNTVIFGRPLFQAVYEHVLKLRWWEKWEDVPEPVPLVEYVDVVLASLLSEAA